MLTGVTMCLYINAGQLSLGFYQVQYAGTLCVLYSGQIQLWNKRGLRLVADSAVFGKCDWNMTREYVPY